MTFEDEVQKNINLIAKDRDFLGLSNIWIRQAIQYKYALNFSWLGRPIMQIPNDIYAYQELIWKVKPDLIIETGIAHGGSLIMSASMLALLDYCEESVKHNMCHDERLNTKRLVIGIDNDIRPHNKKEIEQHPLSNLIQMFEGSSINKDIIKQTSEMANEHRRIMVFLDSNHTHNHVLEELKAYAPLVTKNSYCVVWDTGIEDLPEYLNTSRNRPWGKGNNPKTAVHEFLKTTDMFEIDKTIEHKLIITASPDGFLRRVK